MAKKEGIRKLFDNIAGDYDRLNHILSLNIDKSWRRKAVREIADTAEPLKILDEACGTCDFTIEIAKAVPQGSKVTGIDLSEGMLQIGREKCRKEGITAELQTGDCEAMPYDEGTFDRIGVAFGVRNFEHQREALTEIKRTIRKGGHLIVLEFSNPSCAFVRWCYRLYSHYILPAIGRLVSKHATAYTYLPESIDQFASPEAFSTLLKEVGFDSIERKSQSMGIAHIYIAHKA